ncbi:type IV secretion protein Rhs [Citrobacter farmeri]
MGNEKYGTLHLLTTGEINMLRPLYHDTTDYAKIWVHCDSWFPFNLQQKGIGVTPCGEMYFVPGSYVSDFSLVDHVDIQQMFIHESVHVWQYQNGMNVMLRGLYSWAANYNYEMGKNLLGYSMEQQAQIIADFWVLSTHGAAVWLNQSWCTAKEECFNTYTEPQIYLFYKDMLCNFPYYHF